MVAALLVACSDHEPSGPYAPLDQLDALLQHAECTRDVRCGMFPTQAACESTIERGNPNLLLSPELTHERDAGHLIYDGARVQACLDAIANASCSPYAAALFDPIEDCVRRSIKPLLANGETCEHDWACISGACEGCDWVDTCCSGTCGPPSYQRVVIDVPIGGACGSFGVCAEGLFCDDNGDQTCKPLIAEGQPCTEQGGTGETYFLRCAAELTCDEATGVCKPPPGLGEHCVFQCSSIALICNDTGTCVAQTAEGDACLNGNDCPAWLACIAGKCTAEGIGAPCPCAGSNEYCGGTDPQNPICEALHADGDACTEFWQCESGFCDSGRCSRC